MLMLKNWFFNAELKISSQQVLIYFSFMNWSDRNGTQTHNHLMRKQVPGL